MLIKGLASNVHLIEVNYKNVRIWHTTVPFKRLAKAISSFSGNSLSLWLSLINSGISVCFMWQQAKCECSILDHWNTLVMVQTYMCSNNRHEGYTPGAELLWIKPFHPHNSMRWAFSLFPFYK
jgi:hypothetical protein